MEKIAKKIVKYRVMILIIATVLLIPSFIGFIKTKVNYDILTSLPDSSESIIGQNILGDDFGQKATAMVTVKGLPDKEVKKIADKIEDLDGVNSVIWIGKYTDTIPTDMIPSDIRSMIDNGEAKLIMITFDYDNGNEKTLAAIKETETLLNENVYIGGLAAVTYDTMNVIESEFPIYVLVAGLLAMVALFLGLKYTLAPVIFIVGLIYAIAYNYGTNIFLGEISYITKSIAAILQLAVSMDFSIFLLERYDEEHKHSSSSEEAMVKAITATFTSISGSSLTTIAGFMAMITMDLSLGKNLGIVMAKGVVLAVLCAVVILPALILTFDKPLHKYQHKTIFPSFKPFAKFTVKHYKAFLVLAVVIAIPFYLAQKQTPVYYNLLKALPSDMASNVGTSVLKEEFNMPTTNFILVDKDLSSQEMDEVLDTIKNTDGIVSIASLDEFIGSGIPSDFLPSDISGFFEGGNYKLILANSEYEPATDAQNTQCETLTNALHKIDPTAYVTGEGALDKDLVTVANHDFNMVNYVSIIAVFIIIAFVFKSLTIPLVLVSAIELAIFINMGIPYFTNQAIPFISSIVIGTIQLGATIDYSILMTSRYKEERTVFHQPRKQAVINTVSSCASSIITSGLCFFAATIGVVFVSKIDLIKSICSMLARGSIISVCVILFIFPALLLLFGPIIEKTSSGFKGITNK